MINLKEFISDYLLEKARDEADKSWEEKGYSLKDIDKWLSKTDET